jgi:hypothetical protein
MAHNVYDWVLSLRMAAKVQLLGIWVDDVWYIPTKREYEWGTEGLALEIGDSMLGEWMTSYAFRDSVKWEYVSEGKQGELTLRREKVIGICGVFYATINS